MQFFQNRFFEILIVIFKWLHLVEIAHFIRNFIGQYMPVPITLCRRKSHKQFPCFSIYLFCSSLNYPFCCFLQIWVYAEDVYRFVPQITWEKYQAVFPSAWTASAFKGAFGETFYVPNVKRHFDNNKNWLLLMAAEESKFKKGFRGITITGWQRYVQNFKI